MSLPRAAEPLKLLESIAAARFGQRGAEQDQQPVLGVGNGLEDRTIDVAHDRAS